MPVTREEIINVFRQQGLTPSELVIEQNFIEANADEDVAPSPVAPITSTEAFTKSAKRSIGPSLIGIGAGSLAAAPFTGGSSLLIPLLVGAGVGTGASLVASKVQEPLLEKVQGEEDYKKGLAELETARQQHPVASFAGEFVPGLLTARPSLGNLKAIGRAISNPATLSSVTPEVSQALKVAATQAAVGGGIEAGLEGAQGQELSPGRILGQALGGATLTKPWLLGKTRAFGYREPGVQPTEDVLTQPAPLPKSRQLTFPSESISSEGNPIVTPFEGTSLSRKLAYQQAMVEKAYGDQPIIDVPSSVKAPIKFGEGNTSLEQPVSTDLRQLGKKLNVNEISTQEPDAGKFIKTHQVGDYTTGMKDAASQNLKQPLNEGEIIQDEYDRGIRHQPKSQLAKDIVDYLEASGRSKTENADVNQLATELASKQNVKRVIYDPNYLGNAGEFNPSFAPELFYHLVC